MTKATKRLSKRVVDAIDVPAKGAPPIEVWDDAIAGFHIRVPSSGRAVYRFWYRAGAVQRVVTLGPHGTVTAESARERAKALSGAVAEGRDPVAEREAGERAAEEARRRAITVSALIDSYLEEGPALNPAKRARSWEHDRSTLNAHVRPLLGKLMAHNVRRGDVEKMIAGVIAGKTKRTEKLGPRAKRVVRGGPAAARAAAVATMTLFTWAARRDLVVQNPAKGAMKPKAGKRERFLSDEEIARLFSVIAGMEQSGKLHSTFGDTLRLLALTGARRGEIEGLRWAEIDFQRGVAMLPVHRSKTGRKTIPLSAPALAILSGRVRTNQYVFPSPMGDDKPANALSKNWQRVRRAAELPDVRLHDLRHTLASLLVARGASLPMIGRVLGHASAQTTQRYAHLQADPLRALVDDATAGFMGATTPAVSAEVTQLPTARKRP
jgi:integrase